MGRYELASKLLQAFGEPQLSSDLLRFHYAYVQSNLTIKREILTQIPPNFPSARFELCALLDDLGEHEKLMSELTNPIALVFKSMHALTHGSTINAQATNLIEAFYAGSVKAGLLLLGYGLIEQTDFEDLYGRVDDVDETHFWVLNAILTTSNL